MCLHNVIFMKRRPELVSFIDGTFKSGTHLIKLLFLLLLLFRFSVDCFGTEGTSSFLVDVLLVSDTNLRLKFVKQWCSTGLSLSGMGPGLWLNCVGPRSEPGVGTGVGLAADSGSGHVLAAVGG